MAEALRATKKQSLAEIRQWDFDFAGDLYAGVTILSATATHTPPSGSASTPAVGVISGSIVPVKFGPLSVTGVHVLNILATFSNAEKSEIRLEIEVDY